MHSTPLVIGCDSLIGSALFDFFKTRTICVVGTTRRAGTSHLVLNFEADLSLFTLPSSIGVVYLCAAISNLETCKNDPVGTRYINVERTQMLIDKFLTQGVYVVFLSSDLAANSGTEYGSQKRAIERYLEGKDATVVRLGKVITAKEGLLSNWVRELEAGRPIEAFDDYYFSPISIEKVLAVFGDEKMLGAYSKILISANEPLTYFDAIDFIAEKRGLDRSLIVPKASGAKQSEAFVLDSHRKEYCFSAWDTLTELFGTDTNGYKDS